MDPTPEQAAIVDAAKTTPDNILINALAGAAKTTTLELICKAITNIPILSLAFNKRIAEEMSKRLPGHVECKTMNALGHRVWSAACNRRLIVATDKMHKILREEVNGLSGAAKDEAWDSFSETLKWLQRAKRDGYVPATWKGPFRQLTTYAEWIEAYDEVPSPSQRMLINIALQRSIAAAYEGNIDFDDQIYMPVIFGGVWPRFPLVLIDEAQDLNELQHEMLAKLVAKRIIAVGDPWQSIYGFRGAISNGMTALRDRFSMREMQLSITFRLPLSGVERAHFRVPHMQPAAWAVAGTVQTLRSWSADDIPENAAIICRNNAPLISLAFRLLRDGRAIKLVGLDIGAGLVRILRKLGPETTLQRDIPALIQRWTDSELRRARRAGAVCDKMDCLIALTEGRATLGEAIRYAESLFKCNGPIQLLSGHKSKGLEWDTVFHLDPWRIPNKYAITEEAKEQEWNVKYVIETRFKQTLNLVDLDGYNG